MATVGEALSALGITEWVLRGEPTTEDEFNEMFKKITGADANGSAIESSNPSDFGTTWSAVSAKMTELTNAAPMKELRRQRDEKLAECDWWGASDNTMTTAQTNYRQALRDLPDGAEPTWDGVTLGNVTCRKNQYRFVMRTSDDVLDNVLGITDVVETTASQVTLPEVVPPQSDSEDMDNDYKYQRENFYRLVERGQDAIDGILELARESEHPRSYEVAGQLIKNVADVTEKLGDLQSKMKKLKEVPNTAPKNVTNALFVGSTAELQKMLKGK